MRPKCEIKKKENVFVIFIDLKMQCFNYIGKKGFFLLLCLNRVSSCSYVSPGAMEKSKQCSYGVENVYVLIDFVYENDLVAVE